MGRQIARSRSSTYYLHTLASKVRTMFRLGDLAEESALEYPCFMVVILGIVRELSSRQPPLSELVKLRVLYNLYGCFQHIVASIFCSPYDRDHHVFGSIFGPPFYGTLHKEIYVYIYIYVCIDLVGRMPAC